MIVDGFILVLIASCLALGGLLVALCSARYYRLALFLVAISPIASTIFMPNPSVDMEMEAEVGFGSYLRIGMLLLCGTAGTILFLRAKPRNGVPLHLVLLGVFVLIALASTAYSIDPRTTFIRAASSAAVFSFLLGLHCWLKDPERLHGVMETLFLSILLVLALNVFAAVFLPDKAWLYPDMSRFQGLLDQPNVMGSFCMLSYPVLLWKHARGTAAEKWIVVCVGCVVVFLHLMTGSRGSLLTAAILTSVWFLTLRQWTRLIAFVSLVGVVALLAVTLLASKFERIEADDATGLNGRPEFWQASLELLMERPLLGYGYAVEGKVWEDPRFNKPGYFLWSGSAKTSLHNGYLSVAIGGGIIALVLWCALLGIPLSRSLLSPGNEYRAFAISVIVASLLRNFIESEIQPTGAATGILFWVAWVIAGHDILQKLPEPEELKKRMV